MRGRKQKEPAGMNPGEIFAALDLLEKERGIPKAAMLEKVVKAITTAYQRDHKDVDEENIIVEVDEAHNDLRMFIQKTIVDEEDYVDPFNEMPLEEAHRISARYQIGDVINIPVDKMEFGRIAAGNGKQVIIQGLREAERGKVYDEFNSKQHEILTGEIKRIDPRNGAASLTIGTGAESTEALLLAGEQVPGEPLAEGMHIKVYVVDVRHSTRGPQVLISRTHPGLVKRLFELEVPEIFDGTVEVKSIAREAGSRTKMAVWSNEENVDPIGACVGPKGQRVAAIVEELRGEKIDIIKYSEDPAEFIAAALAPADVVHVGIANEGKACRCIVPDDQLSLAIGKEGQNARLAARLTGYKIDIKPQSYRGGEEDDGLFDGPEAPAEEAAPSEEAAPAAEKEADAASGEAAQTSGEEDRASGEAAQAAGGFFCKTCGYVYEGETLPPDFVCPVCGAVSAFVPCQARNAGQKEAAVSPETEDARETVPED